MKQVNLLPRNYWEPPKAFIHPFWKRFSAFFLICVGLALGIHVQFQAFVVKFDQQLLKSKSILDKVDPELKRFQQLVNERDQLKQMIASFQDGGSKHIPDVVRKKKSITQILERVVLAMPADVWLRILQCDYESKRLVIEGSAVSNEAMQRFITDGLMQGNDLSNLMIHNVRLLESKEEIQFSLSLEFAPENGIEKDSKG
ncbi:MAG: hypothetical protein C4527_01045 [Candidatus Omnitrophota bacterium]|jgi:Tfp pilus assembly protein PilN|nr:MAG: hypothetical protein C4527_01045 [Candidatus Omnitrophota bacterium]